MCGARGEAAGGGGSRTESRALADLTAGPARAAAVESRPLPGRWDRGPQGEPLCFRTKEIAGWTDAL